MPRHTSEYDVRRVPAMPDRLFGGAAYDYADSFQVELAKPDEHTAEEWARACLEQAAPIVRGVVRFVHARVARFELSTEPGNVLGWQIVSTAPDVLHLQTAGPLLRAVIIARRRSPTTAGFTTYLVYKRPITRLIWVAVGPLHRAIAPYLLARAASTLTGESTARV